MSSLVDVVTLADEDLVAEVLPSRGLDIGTATLDSVRFSWRSPLGYVPWQGDFARSFGGGLVVTCGLRNVGAASEGQPMHGWYSSLPARDVEVTANAARGRVIDAEVPGPTLELTREIRVDRPAIRITDVVRNAGVQPEPAPILYHVNLLWDSLETDAQHVVPRDDDARAGDWRTHDAAGPERVYEHHGATEAMIELGGMRITVRSNLSRLWQWIEPSYGVLGIEPANCSVQGRAHDRAAGRLPMLAPGESRTTTLEIVAEPA